MFIDYKMNKFTIKDILVYLKIILKGNLIPFLKNEINNGEIKDIYFKIKNNIDNTDYRKRLIIRLKKYYNNAKDIYLTNSGRDALYFILLNLKLKKKEIIIPSYCCLGLVEPILELKYEPFFIDIDENLNPSFESIKSSISKKTAAVIIPHIGGTFAKDTKKIIKLCNQKKIVVIEDCCQAFGLRKNSKKVGTFADIAFFSSGQGKPVFTPEGGWIVTKKDIFKSFKMPNLLEQSNCLTFKKYLKFSKKYSENVIYVVINKLKDLISSILDQFITNKPVSKINKNKMKLSNLGAYIILEELKKIGDNNDKRKELANYWKEKHKSNVNIKFWTSSDSIFNKLYASLDLFQKKQLLLKGIELESGYKPLHLRYDFGKYKTSKLINTNKVWKNIYALPTRPSLHIDNLT